MNDCHRLATCTPDGDSYTCKCNKGFFGNGTHCYDPCNATNCPDNSMCINLDMSNTTCRCDKDYFLHNGTCKKIDFAYEVRALTCIDITFVIFKAFRFEWCYFLIKTFDFQFWLKDDLLFLTASSQQNCQIVFRRIYVSQFTWLLNLIPFLLFIYDKSSWQVTFTIRSMNFTRELADFMSRRFDENKRMVEREFAHVLRRNTSLAIMGVKLVRFNNNTGFAEANFLVIMNETARFQNNTIFDLRNAIANGTFRSLFVHQQFPVRVQSKFIHSTNLHDM